MQEMRDINSLSEDAEVGPAELDSCKSGGVWSVASLLRQVRRDAL